jgi:hypothetical protein
MRCGRGVADDGDGGIRESSGGHAFCDAWTLDVVICSGEFWVFLLHM